jgi:hypothetical protein
MFSSIVHYDSVFLPEYISKKLQHFKGNLSNYDKQIAQKIINVIQ